ncbi:DUF4089 domain-containing protein [Caenimonas koreensis]|uniref:DUF4089 domain-containing protein n=1 Tax=Caenimonas koreensis DSM 17982 TaxID=1121255 RepID=A0A844BAP9_9BURK|nr:DUF4089 domain-containing protein [Caenimonas koreensis]MRD48659.1 DUF4089 domain-containing protein [Caenimonas koreensis DSM 17982]
MHAEDLLVYVKAAAAVLELPMDDERVAAVAAHLARTAAMARQLQAADIAPEDEPAEIYRPAPFPVADGSQEVV